MSAIRRLRGFRRNGNGEAFPFRSSRLSAFQGIPPAFRRNVLFSLAIGVHTGAIPSRTGNY